MIISPLAYICYENDIRELGIMNFSGDTDRSIILGQYIVDNKCTVRACAKAFGISKSTVHKDVSEKLQKTKPQLYKEVKKILDFNKSERHIRGGMATKHKYEEQKLKINSESNE